MLTNVHSTKVTRVIVCPFYLSCCVCYYTCAHATLPLPLPVVRVTGTWRELVFLFSLQLEFLAASPEPSLTPISSPCFFLWLKKMMYVIQRARARAHTHTHTHHYHHQQKDHTSTCKASLHVLDAEMIFWSSACVIPTTIYSNATNLYILCWRCNLDHQTPLPGWISISTYPNIVNLHAPCTTVTLPYIQKTTWPCHRPACLWLSHDGHRMWLSRLENRTVTPLTQVRFPGAAKDFLPKVNFQCRLFFGVRTHPCAIACINIYAHDKDPVVHVRVRWIMATQTYPARTISDKNNQLDDCGR